MVADALARLRSLTASETKDADASGLLQGLHPTIELALELAARRADGADYLTPDDVPNIAGVVVLRDTKDETSSKAERS